MVKANITLLDTGTLVAALYTDHPQHAWANAQLDRAEQGQPCLSTHTLAEVYKVLTGHPHIRMAPGDALQLMDGLLQNYRRIPLTEADYHAALSRCASQNLSGSVLFDALIAQAALSAGAGALVTLNPIDFRRLGEDVAALVVSP